MNERLFQHALFAVIEHITRAELTNQGKKLVIAYYNESKSPRPVDKAREAITRYTVEPIPTLAEIREKSKSRELDPLDHLLLKMEFRAGK